MKKIFVFLTVFTMILPFSNLHSQVCGNIDGDPGGNVDISDLVYLIDHLAINGPAPLVFDDANVNNCEGLDWVDAEYLIAYMFRGGPGPCPISPDCSIPVIGSVTVDHIEGSYDGNKLITGRPIIFHIRFNNTTGEDIKMFSHAFKISSPDGAEWHDASVSPAPLADNFDLGFFDNNYSHTGNGTDTVFAAAICISGDGMTAGSDATAFTIQLGEFDQFDVGKTIVFDTTFFEPGTTWRWSRNGSTSFKPSWNGPMTFTIVDPPTTQITLDNISYSPPPGKIYSDRDISFNLRLKNDEPYRITGMTNGFRVYSPDGAEWGGTTGDTIGTVGYEMFDLVFNIMEFSTNGIAADTLGFGGVLISSPGMPPGFDEVSYAINIGPIDPIHNGKTICLDSCFFPPSGIWMWAGDGTDHIPYWDGPHCFEIIEAPDTLINLVQWPLAEGGNDHWYGIIPTSMTWDEHRALVEGYYLEGDSGHLATITSAEENQFIYDNLLVGNTDQPIDEYFLGGNLDGDWTWITGEAFGYENWNTGEPNGSGEALTIWGASTGSSSGLWNDIPVSNLRWSIVEFGQPMNPVSADSLIIASADIGAGISSIPVMTQLVNPIKGATIPIEIPEGIVVDGLSFNGLITENWDYNFSFVKPDSGFVTIALANSFGEQIPADTATVAMLLVHANMGSCSEPMYVHWDTALIGDVSRQLTFSSLSAEPIYPGYNTARDRSTILPFLPGDVSDDAVFDIEDIVFTIDYMFLGGPPPNRMNALDVNGDCLGPDIGDLVYMIDYTFNDGGVPLCGCIYMANNKALPMTISTVELKTVYENGNSIVVVSSEIDLKGIQLKLNGQFLVEPENMVSDKFDFIYGNKNGVINAGLFDLDGGNYLSAGNHQLIKLRGEFEIISAVVADTESRSFVPIVTGKSGTLPTDFKLHQNYPNPFNPVTEISMSIPHATEVSLKIYNVMGREVAVIYEGFLEAGRQSFTWDASTFSSGVYLYKLESAEYTETKKMLLLK